MQPIGNKLSSCFRSFLAIFLLAESVCGFAGLPLRYRSDGLEMDGHENKNGTYPPQHADDLDYEDVILCDGIDSVNYTARCEFIKSNDDCQNFDGFINYLQFIYCAFADNEAMSTIAVIVLILMLVYLFLILGTIAASFFCPSLSSISKSLGLSDNVAGVTFLAFGNGAPDIFACIAAVTSGGSGDENGLRLVVGELFGGGVFVTTVVVGAVAMVASPFRLDPVPFMRDVIFYLGACFWTFWIIWDGRVTFFETFGYIGLYVVFVAFVIIGHKCSQHHEKQKQGTDMYTPDVEGVFILTDSQKFRIEKVEQETKKSETLKPLPTESSAGKTDNTLAETHSTDSPAPQTYGTITSTGDSDGDTLVENMHIDYEPLFTKVEIKPGVKGRLRVFFLALVPIDHRRWKYQKLVGKILDVLKMPVMFLAILTIPLVDHEKDMKNWNKILNCLHMITAPVFSTVVTMCHSVPVSDQFLVWHVALIIGAILSVLVFLTSSHDKPPVYHWVFAYAGFGMGVVWIYATANEIINALQALGIMFDLSEELLGFLLLAIGNSIADLVTDTTNAKAGRPVMSIGACFGGPLFNMLLGFGIAGTIGAIRADGEDLMISYQPLQAVLFFTMAVSLLSSLLIMLVYWFKVTKPYGVYLFILYIVFLIIAILVETEVINL